VKLKNEGVANTQLLDQLLKITIKLLELGETDMRQLEDAGINPSDLIKLHLLKRVLQEGLGGTKIQLKPGDYRSI